MNLKKTKVAYKCDQKKYFDKTRILEVRAICMINQ